MRISVIISTYNRSRGLREALRALRYQTWSDFEVVVVNGPSTDGTEEVLAEFAGDIRVATCPEVNLSKSRNIGIATASGDVVAFIDDDAIPEPSWLAELGAAYDSDAIGGAGGIVYNHTGHHLQYQYSICDRAGTTRFDVTPPFDAYLKPGADPFLYLQGTNVSIRRRCLVEIGGFDEEIEYMYDEVEVCMRLIDAGYRLRPLDGAAVHHKYLASHRRNQKRIVFDPFVIVRNRFYFALQNGRGTRTIREVFDVLTRYVEATASGAEAHFAAGEFDAGQLEYFLRRLDEAVEVGTNRGLNQPRVRRNLPPPDRDRFRPFPTLRPEGRRLAVCFITQEYPPEDFGGVGRFSADLAIGFAARGHEVHVVTRSPDITRVDLEDGVWMHRLAPARGWLPDLQHVPLVPNLTHIAAVYDEVCRIHARRPLDVVSAPLWACEGLICSLDPRFPTVLTLMTMMKMIATMHPSWDGSVHTRQLIALEGATVAHTRYLHPISDAILQKVRADYGSTAAEAQVVPLGIRDRRDEYPRRRGPEDRRVRVLFVGRLERRKGVDLLLEAALELIPEFPEVDFILAGKETPHTEIGRTYRAAFEQAHGRDPALVGRVRFAGAISEEELYQLYADCDLFCLPSRYESFGLVLVEAMMFGKPVVGCAIGGMPEIVEVGGNGFLAEPDDAASLADCLRRLVADEGLRRRLGERSRALYEQRFCDRRMVDQTLDYYRRIAAGHEGSTGGDGPTPTDGRDAVAPRLAGVVAETTGVTPEVARRGAELLLNYPAMYYLSVLQELWTRPADQFVRGLYTLLLNREADPQGLASFLTVLERGTTRAEVVRNIATTDEARSVRLPTSWLAELGQLERRAIPADAPISIRLRRRIGALPVLGQLARSARRLVYLPWNIRTLYLELRQWREALRRQDEAICEVRQLLSGHRVLITDETRRLEDQLRDQGRRLRDLQSLGSATADQIRPLAEQLRDQGLRLDQLDQARQALVPALAEPIRDQARRLQSLAETQQMLCQWVSLLQRKMEMLSLDVRERIPPVPEEEYLPEPRIVDPESYGARLARLGDEIRVNLGCGEKPLPDYINVDFRELPDVDVAADARRLPFEPGTLAEVASSHLVEHFREHHFRTVVLPYWKSLLRPDGVLRIVCPNWGEMIRRLDDGRMTLSDFKFVTFGAQDYPGDDHSAMYTPQTLSDLLREVGFGRVEVVAEARENGLCPEMELIATPMPEEELLLANGRIGESRNGTNGEL